MKTNIVKIQQIIKDSGLSQFRFCLEIEIETASLIRCLQGKSQLSLTNIVKIADYAKITDIRELLIYEKLEHS